MEREFGQYFMEMKKKWAEKNIMITLIAIFQLSDFESPSPALVLW